MEITRWITELVNIVTSIYGLEVLKWEHWKQELEVRSRVSFELTKETNHFSDVWIEVNIIKRWSHDEQKRLPIKIKKPQRLHISRNFADYFKNFTSEKFLKVTSYEKC